MTDKLPIGVVGVGALGRHHARHLANIEEADLVGVFDIDPAVGRAVAEEVGTTARSSLEDLLGRVGAVSIAVPPCCAAVITDSRPSCQESRSRAI